MDRSAWKLNDSLWVEQRKKNWPIFLARIKAYHTDAKMSELVRCAEDYYFYGIMEDRYDVIAGQLPINDYFSMHPSLDLAAARDIIAFHDEVAHGVRGHFGQFYLEPRGFSELIEKHIVSPSICRIVIRAAYGESYEEAARLRGFDPNEQAFKTGDRLLEELGNWLGPNEHYEYYPAAQLIPFAIGAMEYFTVNDLEKDSFNVKRLAKLFGYLNDDKIRQFPKLREFEIAFKKALAESKVIDEIKAIFQV